MALGLVVSELIWGIFK